MVDETRFEKFEVKHGEPDLDDRERMTERALAAIRKGGPAAALEKCRTLADQITAELLKREKLDPFAASDLQAYLTRANAVMKYCGAPRYAEIRGRRSIIPFLQLILSVFLRRLLAFLRQD
jgi:hypothetical protein